METWDYKVVTSILEGWRFMTEQEMNNAQFSLKDLHSKVPTLPVDSWVILEQYSMVKLIG